MRNLKLISLVAGLSLAFNSAFAGPRFFAPIGVGPWVATTWLKNDTNGKVFTAASGSIFAPEWNQAWSFSVLVKFVDVAAGKTLVFSKTKNGSPYSGQILHLETDGRIDFQISSSQGVNWLRVGTAAGTIVSGTKYRITYTFDGTGTFAGTKVYVNNVDTATVNRANSLSATTINTTAFVIGSEWTGNWQNGYIKDLAWWNKKLSAAEELALTSGSIDLSTHLAAANLQNFWRFQTSGVSPPDSATVVYDRKGSDNLTSSTFVSGDYVTYP